MLFSCSTLLSRCSTPPSRSSTLVSCCSTRVWPSGGRSAPLLERIRGPHRMGPNHTISFQTAQLFRFTSQNVLVCCMSWRPVLRLVRIQLCFTPRNDSVLFHASSLGSRLAMTQFCVSLRCSFVSRLVLTQFCFMPRNDTVLCLATTQFCFTSRYDTLSFVSRLVMIHFCSRSRYDAVLFHVPL